jgi:hypothetical protein
VEQYAQREKLMEFLSGHIRSFIRAKDSYKTYKNGFDYKIKKFFSFILFWTGKRFGNYLIILYVFVKLLYIVNVVGQLFLMTRLLGISNYHLLGFEILHRMALGLDMISNNYFPKVTHCDFKIRELGSDHQYTVQCVLSINIFTEKIYIIVWFWFVILSVFTIFDLVLFLFRNCFPSQRYYYVKKHVVIFSTLKKNSQMPLMHQFANKYLKPDLVLVLKIIATNVNDLVVSELVKNLWEQFSAKQMPATAKDDDVDFIQDYDYGDPAEDDDEVDGEKTPSFPIQTQNNQSKINEPDDADDSSTMPTSKSEPKGSGLKSILRSLRKSNNDDDTDDKQVIKKKDTGASGPISMV